MRATHACIRANWGKSTWMAAGITMCLSPKALLRLLGEKLADLLPQPVRDASRLHKACHFG